MRPRFQVTAARNTNSAVLCRAAIAQLAATQQGAALEKKQTCNFNRGFGGGGGGRTRTYEG
jgi:hypothetical protein